MTYLLTYLCPGSAPDLAYSASRDPPTGFKGVALWEEKEKGEKGRRWG